jgi:hypothetical protein
MELGVEILAYDIFIFKFKAGAEAREATGNQELREVMQKEC